MERRKFIQQSTVFTASFFIAKDLMAKNDGPIYGHGMKYRMDNSWGKLDSQNHPVNDCHEMVQDSKGRLILLTNETKNNILIYDTAGKLLDFWGHDFPGGHGLTLTLMKTAPSFCLLPTPLNTRYIKLPWMAKY
jgi:peptidylamidoglycolate lyase